MKLQVQKIGPWGLKDEGGLIASGKKGDVMAAARSYAERSALNGEDAVIEVLDDKGRPVKIEPYYADEHEREAKDEAKKAAKAAAA